MIKGTIQNRCKGNLGIPSLASEDCSYLKCTQIVIVYFNLTLKKVQSKSECSVPDNWEFQIKIPLGGLPCKKVRNTCIWQGHPKTRPIWVWFKLSLTHKRKHFKTDMAAGFFSYIFFLECKYSTMIEAFISEHYEERAESGIYKLNPK